MHEAVVPIIIISCFFATLLIINRKQLFVRSFEDFAVANRSVGVIGLTFAVFSAWYVAATYTAWAGMAVTQGSATFYVTIYATSVLVFMYMYSSRTWILGSRFGLMTQGDLLALRYRSRTMGFSSSLINFISHVGFLALEFITLGYVIEYATYGVVSRFWATMIAAAIMFIYVNMGGLKTVITANIFQGILMVFLGTIITIRLINVNAGGITNLMDVLIQNNPEFTILAVTPQYWTSILLCAMLGASLWQYVHNRVIAAESITTIKKGSLLACILGTIYYIFVALLMMHTNNYEYAVQHSDEAFFWFIKNYGGPVMLGLMSSIVLATATGSISSMIHTYSTQISNDLVGSIRRKPLTDKDQVRLTRILMLILVVFAVIVANLNLTELINLALVFYNGIVVLFPVVILGLFWRRANTAGALIGMISGFILIVIMVLLNIYPGGWFPGVFGFALTSIIMIVAGFIKEPDDYVNALFDYMEHIIDGKKASVR